MTITVQVGQTKPIPVMAPHATLVSADPSIATVNQAPSYGVTGVSVGTTIVTAFSGFSQTQYIVNVVA